MSLTPLAVLNNCNICIFLYSNLIFLKYVELFIVDLLFKKFKLKIDELDTFFVF